MVGAVDLIYSTQVGCTYQVLRGEGDPVFRRGKDLNLQIFASNTHGGRGEIRTPETLSGLSALQADALDHYATLPLWV